MNRFAYYFHHYWLSGVLFVGVLVAIWLVYMYRDHIIIKGSGRK